MSILETDIPSLNLVAYSSLILGSIFKHRIETPFSRFQWPMFQKYFIILYQWPLLSMLVFLISIWRQLTKGFIHIYCRKLVRWMLEDDVYWWSQRKRRWWKNGKSYLRSNTRLSFILDTLPFVLIPLKQLYYCQVGNSSLQFWCCWRLLETSSCCYWIHPLWMEDPSRAEIGKEKKGKGREGKEQNRREGKGRGRNFFLWLRRKKKTLICLYTA